MCSINCLVHDECDFCDKQPRFCRGCEALLTDDNNHGHPDYCDACNLNHYVRRDRFSDEQ